MSPWADVTVSHIGHLLARHHRLLTTKLDALSTGEIDRLMIQMPPGSAKSTYASVLLPAWWFTQHPRDSVIAACHTIGLASYFGRRARAVIADELASLGYEIAATDRSSAHWSTNSGGEYYAVGVRGAIIGRRADLAIIDDPVRSQSDVDSSAHRERLWEWYQSELIPRLKPKARIVLVSTRWHEDDLCGRLLERESGEWDYVNLAAFAGESDQLQRVPGEVLWSDWEDAQALSRRRNVVGEHTWTAQFQQSPRPLGKGLFATFKIWAVDEAPPLSAGRVVRAWDLAATMQEHQKDPDWTVGVKLMRQRPDKFTLLDVARFRTNPVEVQERIFATARLDGPQVTIGIPEDPGQAGKSQVSYMTGLLAGYSIISSRETGAKSTRALPLACQIEHSNLAIVRASWNHTFLEELQDFPVGRKDDQVDALTRAFNMLLDPGTSARQTNLPHMER